jgi:hypothetical protein
VSAAVRTAAGHVFGWVAGPVGGPFGGYQWVNVRDGSVFGREAVAGGVGVG